MSKAEILDLWNWKCSHGHNGLTHYNCWVREKDVKERIGFLDIEASNLKANFGIMFSWAIKILGEDLVLYDHITRKDLKDGTMDRRIVESCIDHMVTFDRVIGHYSTKYDIPFIRTRALIHKIPFPRYGELKHSDTYYMAKRSLCLHSNRQDVIAESLFGINIKTRIDPHYWIAGLQGDEESLEYILDHNIKDVLQLEDNYKALEPFIKATKRSI